MIERQCGKRVGRLALRSERHREVFEGLAGVRMMGWQALALDSRSALKRTLGLIELPARRVDGAKQAQHAGECRVSLPVDRAGRLEGKDSLHLCIFVLPEFGAESRLLRQNRRVARVSRPISLLSDLGRSPDELGGLGKLTLLREIHPQVVKVIRIVWMFAVERPFVDGERFALQILCA